MRMFLIFNWLLNIRISLFIKCVKKAIQNAEFKAKSLWISLQLPNGSYGFTSEHVPDNKYVCS